MPYDATQDMYKKIKAVPKPEKRIGIDTDGSFMDNIVNAGISSKLDISSIESFAGVTQNRDTLYDLIDTMCEDSIIAAILETYAEDATEYNESGKIVWAESPDADVANYVSYLLESMNVEKNIYKWVTHLCKYGDLYLRLFRQSEYEDELFNNKDNTLNEGVKIKYFSKNDKYAHYLEMVPDPAEMFELVKHGKTYGYIKSNSGHTVKKTDNLLNKYYQYAFKRKDVEVYAATEFVHACLEESANRTQEEVNIFINDNEETDYDSAESLKYSVRRGQSLLQNVFKIWRQLMLLENSILLNRLTKSSIVRVIGVEIGDMPKESVKTHLYGVKEMVEQKSALNTGMSMEEYTNPGPIENNIYIPTREGKGQISIQNIGGDVDVKSLADLDYFKNRFYGAFRVPKQYFGDTDDSAGFDGGTSLALISARYAKMIKRIQNTMTQALTDAINLMLIDKNLDSYVNKFTIKMLAPATKEEMDRRDNMSSKIGVVSDIMNLVADIEDPAAKLEILKTLLSDVVSNPEIITIIEDVIESLKGESEEPMDDMEDIDSEQMDFGDSSDFGGGDMDFGDFGDEGSESSPEPEGSSGDLPSIEDTGMDMTDSTNPEFD